jgi:CRP-like cAMP-binding protein
MESRCENCIIRQLNSLRALSKEQLKDISDTKIKKTFKKGDFIFKEGKNLDGVFCIKDGVSKLSKLSENGKDHIVKLATKGDVLGQRAVITDDKSNLSAIAINTMEVCFIPKNKLKNYLNTNPEFTSETLVKIAHELKASDSMIVNMAQKNIRQRLAKLLLYFENQFGSDVEGYIAIILSREDIANLLGTAKETCIRAITALKNEEIISVKGKKIKLENKKKLSNIVEGKLS